MVKLVCISDTHGMHRQVKLPAGDVLVHSGDMSGRGLWHTFVDFAEWLSEQPHQHKVFVLGNHDGYSHGECKKWIADKHPASNIHLLFEESVEIEGLKFWGAPWTPEFFDWSFMRPRGRPLAKTWEAIPEDVDVLITHGPPYGHGDVAPPYLSAEPRIVGCFELLKRVMEVKPRVHIFGHIHEGYGITASDEVGTIFVNAATCTGEYVPSNAPQIIQIESEATES